MACYFARMWTTYSIVATSPFEDEGRVLISPLIDEAQIALLGVSTAPPLNVGPFNVGQTDYLRFHRQSVFLHGR